MLLKRKLCAVSATPPVAVEIDAVLVAVGQVVLEDDEACVGVLRPNAAPAASVHRAAADDRVSAAALEVDHPLARPDVSLSAPSHRDAVDVGHRGRRKEDAFLRSAV